VSGAGTADDGRGATVDSVAVCTADVDRNAELRRRRVHLSIRRVNVSTVSH